VLSHFSTAHVRYWIHDLRENLDASSPDGGAVVYRFLEILCEVFAGQGRCVGEGSDGKIIEELVRRIVGG
jgi:hypothetical protein